MLTLVWALLPANEAQAAATIPEIRAVLAARESAIDSIRIRYKIVSVATIDAELLVSGNRRRLTTSGENSRKSWNSFDGKFGYTAIYDPIEKNFVKEIVKRSQAPEKLLSMQNPLMAYATMVAGTDRPLSTMIPDNASIWEEILNGRNTLQLDLGSHPTVWKGKAALFECVLDADQEFVPVSISWRVDGQSDSQSIVVEEFRDVSDQSLGLVLRFPWRIKAAEQISLHVDSVELNPSIAENEFLPVPQTGTLMTDKSRPGNPTFYTFNSKQALQQQIEKSANAPFPSPTSDQFAVAKPPIGWLMWLSFWFAVAGVISLVAAVVWYWR